MRPGPSLAFRAAVLTLAVQLAACSGGDKNPAGGPGDLGQSGECLSSQQFFAEKLWVPVLSKSCMKCHSPDGLAAQKNADLVLLPTGYPGFMDSNLAIMSSLARTEFDDTSVLLRKPIGEMNHGGAVVLQPDSAEYAALQEFVRRVKEGDTCQVAPTAHTFEDVVLLDPAATLRKASLNLLGRLPPAEQLQTLQAGGDEALSTALDELFVQDAFYARLKEIYNDRFLTDRYMGFNGYAINLLNETNFPNAVDDTYELVSEEDRAKTNRAVAREPLELVAHVVRNDRPFTEILTAPYTVMNPFSAKMYNSDLAFTDPVNENEWREAKIRYFDQDGGIYDYPTAGVLTSPMFLNRFETTPTNRNRHRARIVFDLFLATDILAIGDRPLDPVASARFANPTREDPSCNACHKIIDPVAGAFQKFDDYDQERYRPDREWHAEMFPPGYGSDEMTLDDYPFALNWLGERIARDPRFVRAVVQQIFTALTGQKPLAYPAEPEAEGFAARLKAWEGQDQFFRSTGEAFVGADSSYNLKRVFKAVLMSPYFRASNATGPLAADRALELSAMGTGLLESPEVLSRKITAVVGFPWARGYDKNEWLLFDYKVLYGGIDSDTVVDRLRTPNGVMASVQWRMANEVSCASTAWDFSRPANERSLFPFVSPTDVPEDEMGAQNAAAEPLIRQNLQYLHQRILGETLATDSPELDRSYQLFMDTWSEGRAAVKAKTENESLTYACRARVDPFTGLDLADGQKLEKDANYAIRAWSAVVTYLLSDYQFLYE
ncbi:MAG: hypothetical protein K0R38_5005 [Polyangiaceae bacterium]|nr:hypothetical protein [Polyangiaceae bacterium]